MKVQIKYFNPRAREGRDCCAVVKRRSVSRISIHAPVKGATLDYEKGTEMISISIHAPVKGATYIEIALSTFPTDFNPRAREGRDLRMRLLQRFRGIISIHAPVKGATSPFPVFLTVKGIFQSTRP